MKTKLQKTFARLIALITILTLLPSGMGLAVSELQPEPAEPFEGESSFEENLSLTLSLDKARALISGDVFQNGADRLASLQRFDGGWAWPLVDASAAASPKNTLAPIAQGLAESYLHTADPNHLTALQNSGALLLAKTNNFSPSDGYIAATLDDIFGGSTYTDHVTANFYTPLAAGTYNRNGLGTLHSATSYVNLIRTSRSGTNANLAAWDIGMGLVGAAAAGADTSAWIAGVKAEIDELNSSAYYDVIGLAGAIYGLAYVGEDYDPTGGSHSAAESLTDLGLILLDYQLASGGFTWNAGYQGEGEGNESIQETAYAILALDKLDRTVYLGAIQSAANYTKSVQLSTGGWESYTGGGENNEITGEALWAIHVVYSYEFAGFFQPVDVNAVNTAKAGQAIPVKWRLTDANGTPISDPAVFVNLYSQNSSCTSSVPPDAVETYSGSSGLQYLGDGYWQFNWKTPKNYAGTCRTMYVEFQGDVTSPIVLFKFK